MRIVCPSCQAAYDVPAPVLAAGRTLRCTRCSADFTPAAPDAPAEVAPALIIPVPPAPVPAERLVAPLAEKEPVPRAGPRLAVVAGWVVSLAVLAAMGWGFVVWRAAIQRAWPASARAYAVLGLK